MFVSTFSRKAGISSGPSAWKICLAGLINRWLQHHYSSSAYGPGSSISIKHVIQPNFVWCTNTRHVQREDFEGNFWENWQPFFFIVITGKSCSPAEHQSPYPGCFNASTCHLTLNIWFFCSLADIPSPTITASRWRSREIASPQPSRWCATLPIPSVPAVRHSTATVTPISTARSMRPVRKW